jgi:hypothetical protein
MADFKASTGFRNLVATQAAALNYFVTLHDTGGSTLGDGDTYAAAENGELATVTDGYTQGGKAIASVAQTAGVLDGADVVWANTSGSDLGPASYYAIWASTGTITGAQLVAVKDASAAPQTASTGNSMTVTVTDFYTVNTAA